MLLVEPTKEQTIQANDHVITSDVFPAVNGMEVMPILDDIATKQMMLWLGNDTLPINPLPINPLPIKFIPSKSVPANSTAVNSKANKAGTQ